jgi:Zn-dependent peptidase ImmA (M78 family)
MPTINHDIARWARETAGLTRDEAAGRLGLAPGDHSSTESRLEAIESGREEPSRPQLVRMAKLYRHPLLVFYLAAVPPRGDRGQDFRSLPTSYPAIENALLDALLRDVRVRQGLIRATLEDEEGFEPPVFVGSMSVADGVQSIADAIGRTIGFSISEFRKQRSHRDAFNHLRGRAESAGVFVLLAGNLGSHHTKIRPETFRGYAVADAIAPLVVVNEYDSRAAWSFTLVHELAHIFIGKSGVSGDPTNGRLERFCNEVAAAILLPGEDLGLLDVGEHTEFDIARGRITSFAEERNVSSSMVAYQLYREQRISRDQWSQLAQVYRILWLVNERRRRKKAKMGNKGPNYGVAA